MIRTSFLVLRNARVFGAFVAVAAWAIGIGCVSNLQARDEGKGKEPEAERPLVQVALLLDTSNSMDGLIAQAKAQLWQVVNEFARAKREGRAPRLEVALYEYGNSGINISEGYLRQVVGFTHDLDLLSEKLFALRTNGGDEYCGRVIQSAVNGLYWNQGRGVMKVIYIAGNEPFTQGDVDYRQVCPAARAKGIIVNTIHCGDEKSGIDGRWKDGALLADGMFFCINQNEVPTAIETPYDADLAKLNERLNGTYIPFGKNGKAAQSNQVLQDKNAYGVSPSALASRAGSKASHLYSNAGWDLVDAIDRNTVELEKIDRDDLPEEMRNMTLTERKEYVARKKVEREAICKQIASLNIERKAYIEKKTKETTKNVTLENAILASIHKQAAELGFVFSD